MENIEIKNNEQSFEKKVIDASKQIETLINEVHKKIVWQDKLIKNLIIWLLAKGHILLEWVPWLAKTLTISTLAETLHLWFNRIQFTPDLLPSDLVWTEIYNTKTWNFNIKKWPLFNNFILADEINRAASKVQSALLESMAERQVTLWNETFKLQEPFIVLATQNPIEQSWVYRLPEAQLDRFLLKTIVSYPSLEEEIEMYKKNDSIKNEKINVILNKNQILELQNIVKDIYVSDNIYEYVSNIIQSSRTPEKYWLENIKKYISYWVSPRWWLALISSAKVNAMMNGRFFVIPEDIKEVAYDVLNHRIWITYEAIANDIKEWDIIKEILDWIEVI